LTVLLQLGNKLISLSNDILVLLVLVVRSVRLDDTLASNSVDGARNTASSDESGQVPVGRRKINMLAAGPE
jgi:hypothetical protein